MRFYEGASVLVIESIWSKLVIPYFKFNLQNHIDYAIYYIYMSGIWVFRYMCVQMFVKMSETMGVQMFMSDALGACLSAWMES